MSIRPPDPVAESGSVLTDLCSQISFPSPIFGAGSCLRRLFEPRVNMDSADTQEPQLLLINHREAVSLAVPGVRAT